MYVRTCNDDNFVWRFSFDRTIESRLLSFSSKLLDFVSSSWRMSSSWVHCCRSWIKFSCKFSRILASLIHLLLSSRFSALMGSLSILSLFPIIVLDILLNVSSSCWFVCNSIRFKNTLDNQSTVGVVFW